jgi:hypothetical protein
MSDGYSKESGRFPKPSKYLGQISCYEKNQKALSEHLDLNNKLCDVFILSSLTFNITKKNMESLIINLYSKIIILKRGALFKIKC